MWISLIKAYFCCCYSESGIVEEEHIQTPSLHLLVDSDWLVSQSRDRRPIGAAVFDSLLGLLVDLVVAEVLEVAICILCTAVPVVKSGEGVGRSRWTALAFRIGSTKESHWNLFVIVQVTTVLRVAKVLLFNASPESTGVCEKVLLVEAHLTRHWCLFV